METDYEDVSANFFGATQAASKSYSHSCRSMSRREFSAPAGRGVAGINDRLVKSIKVTITLKVSAAQLTAQGVLGQRTIGTPGFRNFYVCPRECGNLCPVESPAPRGRH